MCVTTLEDENAEDTEAPVVTDPPEQKPSKSDKTKKTVHSKAGSPKAKLAQANGTTAKQTANIKSKAKKASTTGPKRAKVAKLDGETVKEDKKLSVKTVVETKPSTAGKKEGNRFEKKQGKKTKNPMKEKNRMGKNKFRKLKHLLQKQDV